MSNKHWRVRLALILVSCLGGGGEGGGGQWHCQEIPHFWGCCAEGGWKPWGEAEARGAGKVHDVKCMAGVVEEQILPQEL